MGTRGFLGVVVDGVEKLAYNHWDSYPGGLGLDTLRRLRDAGPKLAEQARALRVVDPASKPTTEEIEALRPFADTGVGTGELDDWYVLLRGTQGDITAMLAAGVVEDAGRFPANSLFCEWGYLVDLDAQTFEIYQGFQTDPPTGRFARHGGPDNDGYYPVTLAASWPLGELPSDEAFLDALAEDDGDD